MTTHPPEPGTRAFLTDLRGLAFSEATVPIEVCRDGAWQHPTYGEVTITPELRASFVANFQGNVRRVGDLPLDYDHERGPAPGWIIGLRNEGPRLLADVRLTETGRAKLRAGEYRFFSPEWHPDWQDPETGRRHGPTLFGGGLTNRPFFRGMAAIRCSEPVPAASSQLPVASSQLSVEASEAPAPHRQPATNNQQLPPAMRERMIAVEAENASLRAAEERRAVTDAVAGLAFSEGRVTLGPESRGALIDALMQIPADPRRKVLAAVQGLTFAELGERGFGCPEGEGAGLTPGEEAAVRGMAARNGQKFEDVRRAFVETKTRRAGR
jgi:hypothetical protein